MADFLDKMLVGINKGVNDVKENSKFLMEKAKLNTEVKELEDRKNTTARNLGLLIYECIKNQEEICAEQIRPLSNEMQYCDEQIEQRFQLIQELENNKQQETSNVFIDEFSDTMILCSCGFKNNVGAKFCRQCGTMLKRGDE